MFVSNPSRVLSRCSLHQKVYKPRIRGGGHIGVHVQCQWKALEVLSFASQDTKFHTSFLREALCEFTMIRSSCSRAFNVNIPFLSISRSKNGNLFMASSAGNVGPFPRRVQRSFHSHHMIRQGQETDLESADKNASSIALQKSVQV